MNVLPIKPEESHPWILQKHYSKRLPNIMFAFGLFKKMQLVGVVTYGMPASRSLVIGLCGEEYADFVIELNRLCLQNNEKKRSQFFSWKFIENVTKTKNCCFLC